MGGWMSSSTIRVLLTYMVTYESNCKQMISHGHQPTKHTWYLITALVSQDCCNKVLQTGGLKTTEIYCLKVLEAENPKPSYLLGFALFDSYKGESSHASSSFWCLLPISGIPWLVDGSLQGQIIFSPCHYSLPSMYVSLCSNFHFLLDHQLYWVRAHDNNFI